MAKSPENAVAVQPVQSAQQPSAITTESGMIVRLKRHVGKKFDSDLHEEIEVDLHQSRIFVQTPGRVQQGQPPMVYGYVCHHRGAPINPIKLLPRPRQQEIEQAVNQLLGETAPHRLATLHVRTDSGQTPQVVLP